MDQLASFTTILVVELTGLVPKATSTVISRTAAMELAQSIGNDLNKLDPAIANCALLTPGALYDQTELLRPGFPILEALESVHRAGLQASNGFSPGIVALGSESGERFPIAALNPGDSQWRGPLMMIPALLVAPAPVIDPISEELEPRLLHEGVASSDTRQTLARHFSVEPAHVSYATIADLCALLNVQLENAGLLPLWQLLEHAFLARDGQLEVELPEGNRFLLADKTVTSPFLGLTSWGREDSSTAIKRLGSYLRWTHRQRQYTAALAAYGLTTQMLAESGSKVQGDSPWYRHTAQDRSDTRQSPSRLLITEHAHPELGIIAFSADLRAQNDDLLRRDNYYPMDPRALSPLTDHLKALAAAAGVSITTLRPGGLTIDGESGDLTAADAPGSALVSNIPVAE